MKLFTEATKKLSPEQLQDLSSHFKLKTINPATLKTALLSPVGIDSVLRTLNTDELKVLRAVYQHEDGINYGEIDKDLKLGIHNIERITRVLVQKLLIYTIKNRQLLSNKLDKVYGIEEIAPFIHIENASLIKEKLKGCADLALTHNREIRAAQYMGGEKTVRLLNMMTLAGGIVTLDEAIKKAGEKTVNQLIPELQKKGILDVYQSIEPEFSAYLILDRQYFFSALNEEAEKITAPAIQNGYTAVLNIFYAFDTISTFGLFLTKQNEFRKIDKRRIIESMAWIKCGKGEHYSLEKTAEMSLFLLNRLDCLTVNKDIITVSLRNIKKDIENPRKILFRIIKSLESPADESSIFPCPVDLPEPMILQIILKIFHERPKLARSAVIALALAMIYSQKKKPLNECMKQKERICKEIENTLVLFVILGIVDYHHGIFIVSEPGNEALQMLFKTYAPPRQEKPQKCVYINPDFTILIPTHEISALSLFNLLAHSEIVKQDVLLHALVSKASIVRAQKRGMSLRCFLDALEKHSKNQIPQNLNFLLNEWSTQTIRIDISLSILLKTSHPSFIDELYLGKMKEAIIERISDTHVIISKKHIDDVIKTAQKKDAVISLFMDSEEERDD